MLSFAGRTSLLLVLPMCLLLACDDARSDAELGSSQAGAAALYDITTTDHACAAEPLACDDCPTLDDFLQSCAFATATTCGGTLVASTGLSPSNWYEYCFDADGLLIGRIAVTDVPSRREVEGSDCVRDGEGNAPVH
jgi:hypothetical protein